MEEQKPAKIIFGVKARESLRLLDDSVLRAMYKNFIIPIKRGYEISELQGKYKPSWIITGRQSLTLRAQFADFAKTHQLYHYHFGYPYYQTGRDREYLGDESDGILHIRTLELSPLRVIGIFRIDDKHPTPFSFPTDLTI